MSDRDEHECDGLAIDLPPIVAICSRCCALYIRDLIVLLSAELSRRNPDPTWDPTAVLQDIAADVVKEGKNAAALQFVQAIAPSVRLAE